jgi:hypothetical protein
MAPLRIVEAIWNTRAPWTWLLCAVNPGRRHARRTTAFRFRRVDKLSLLCHLDANG